MAGLVYADANAGYVMVANGIGGGEGAPAGSANVSGTSPPTGNAGNVNVGIPSMPGSATTGSGTSNTPGAGGIPGAGIGGTTSGPTTNGSGVGAGGIGNSGMTGVGASGATGATGAESGGK